VYRNKFSTSVLDDTSGARSVIEVLVDSAHIKSVQIRALEALVPVLPLKVRIEGAKDQ
jgi:hypothetical protein